MKFASPGLCLVYLLKSALTKKTVAGITNQFACVCLCRNQNVCLQLFIIKSSDRCQHDKLSSPRRYLMLFFSLSGFFFLSSSLDFVASYLADWLSVWVWKFSVACRQKIFCLWSCLALVLIDNQLLRNSKETNFVYLLLLTNCLLENYAREDCCYSAKGFFSMYY